MAQLRLAANDTSRSRRIATLAQRYADDHRSSIDVAALAFYLGRIIDRDEAIDLYAVTGLPERQLTIDVRRWIRECGRR